jgi:DNA repair exonuclease SbcCD ATPase subunit
MSDSDGGGTVEEAVDGATGGGDGVDAADPESDGHAVATAADLTEDLADIRSEIETLRSSVDEDVEDLRERFVRLYRDLEGKAEADHDHPETTERLEAVAADVAGAVERLDGVEARVGSLEDALSRLDETAATVENDLAGIDERMASAEGELSETADRLADTEDRLAAAEDRLEDLAAAGEDRSEKLSRVASAVVRAQREIRTVRRERADRDRLDAILRTANRHGIKKADCGGCGNTVRLSLLSTPECPYCESPFDDLDPAERFYRRSTLTVDDRPALEGDVASNADDGDRASGIDRADGTTDESGRGGR